MIGTNWDYTDYYSTIFQLTTLINKIKNEMNFYIIIVTSAVFYLPLPKH